MKSPKKKIERRQKSQKLHLQRLLKSLQLSKKKLSFRKFKTMKTKMENNKRLYLKRTPKTKLNANKSKKIKSKVKVKVKKRN